VNVLEAAAHISSTGTSLRVAHYVETLLVEWPFALDGRAQPFALYAQAMASTIQWIRWCFERAKPLLGPP